MVQLRASGAFTPLMACIASGLDPRDSVDPARPYSVLPSNKSSCPPRRIRNGQNFRPRRHSARRRCPLQPRRRPPPLAAPPPHPFRRCQRQNPSRRPGSCSWFRRTGRLRNKRGERSVASQQDSPMGGWQSSARAGSRLALWYLSALGSGPSLAAAATSAASSCECGCAALCDYARVAPSAHMLAASGCAEICTDARAGQPKQRLVVHPLCGASTSKCVYEMLTAK